MASRSKNQEALGMRLADMLTRLNRGEVLDVHALAEEYGVSIRTIQRDMGRLSPILKNNGPRYYELDIHQHGILSKDEIKRFCFFASIQDLFPEPDRRFFIDKLKQSITVKGFAYEDIKAKRAEFDLISDAVAQQRLLSFDYIKRTAADAEAKHYTVEPYHLVNKNGIWYFIGLDHGRQKTFCFTQMENLVMLPETFEADEELQKTIRETDSIYHGNHLKEIIIKIDPPVVSYFKRRALLPNQEIIRELDDGTLLIACKNINAMEVVPIVQYWIPHSHIVSPSELQEKMEEELKEYLGICMKNKQLINF